MVEAGSSIAWSSLNETLEAEAVLQNEAVQHLNLYPDDVDELLGYQENISIALECMVL